MQRKDTGLGKEWAAHKQASSVVTSKLAIREFAGGDLELTMHRVRAFIIDAQSLVVATSRAQP
jgi:hypothetical protein